ncbi:hypothetical protein NHL50_09605 [Acidimicrobiia bacterium EGI L10123]|uniref:sunset domain-containing protein n=1 Tax=Salinilacustrithrix flava TaxID=2957203 RepID=UPI003D7C2A11|nr:hypothetical protein [Acidimicrobiia bacterium EGI L10123]
MKRFVRFAFLAAALAAVVSAVKSMRRPSDPLPTPAASPSEPWPPLRADAAPTPDAAPAPNTPDPAAEAPMADDVASPRPESTDEATVRVPEPDGVPVAATPTQGASWTEPTDDGECPDGYPIKAKMSSKIFHCPGQLNYDRTTPDRCYVDETAAEADGLRAAKR